MSASVWTFDRFTPGTLAGRASVRLDARRRDLWAGLFGAPDPDRMPQGLFVAAMMEAYVAAIQPRPKGNVHAGQTLVFATHAVPADAVLDFTFTCAAKEMKRDRRWVWFDFAASREGAGVLSGTITAIWAA